MPRGLLLALLALGALLTLTVVPGVFTIDEDNYLVNVVAMRHGRLSVAGTDGLPPSSELVWFDPQAHARRVASTPVASTAPPLYAPIALPFALGGWRGLVLLNTLAYLVATVAVFLYARRYGRDEAAGWLAAAAFALGGHSIEYSQGMWPHMLTVACVASAAALAARVREGDSAVFALAGGFLMGVAAGVRYQNVVLILTVGAGIWLFTPRRWRAAAAYGGGAMIPLATSSLLNRLRLGSWNPLSKGGTYFAYTPGAGDDGGGPGIVDILRDGAVMSWARLVDFSARPPVAGVSSVFLRPDPDSGAYVLGGVVKKAWLQSSPWIGVALVLLVGVWLGSRRALPEQRRELLALSLSVFPMLAVFALAGPGRTDGWSYNQRYFLELVPLVAVAFAWAIATAARSWRPLAIGAAGGIALAIASTARPPSSSVRHEAILVIPLVLVALLLVTWSLAGRGRGAISSRTLSLVVGLGLGWALAIHLVEDVAASRAIRGQNAERLAASAAAMAEPAAVFAYWGQKDKLGPLLLDRDLVIADPFADRGESAGALVDAFLQRRRRVYVLAPFPRELLETMRGDREVHVHTGLVLEILPRGAEGPRPGGSVPRGSR